ncbi:hypothetical protein EJ06DRAFT_46933 [Trichodelitschia bisporula]|uniref:Uncharacterized protein n=1 Tax=Trichodelitschia bisporula TaxID=703511 RepID=A0A6G1HVZ2_9PEZI|nr:hypothetical protein EJ06DRAFT_46933 [Trichodelitschia bisporula]
MGKARLRCSLGPERAGVRMLGESWQAPASPSVGQYAPRLNLWVLFLPPPPPLVSSLFFTNTLYGLFVLSSSATRAGPRFSCSGLLGPPRSFLSSAKCSHSLSSKQNTSTKEHSGQAQATVSSFLGYNRPLRARSRNRCVNRPLANPQHEGCGHSLTCGCGQRWVCACAPSR